MSTQLVRLQVDLEIDIQDEDDYNNQEEIDPKLVAKQVEFLLEGEDMWHKEIHEWRFGGDKSVVDNVTVEVM
jgi:hypothetical protein